MSETITLVAEESPNIDVVTYRGSARLADLTRMSQVDIFDQDANPQGLQRDLNRRHALEAYDYAAREPDEAFPRAFPEMFLNVRDRAAVKVQRHKVAAGERELTLATITVDLDKIAKARSVKISRLDGNHRLWFGNGDGDGREALDVLVPYSLTIGLTREQETSLFLDVNSNQKGLNTSHLAYLRSELTPEELELVEHPARAFTKRLASDSGSPWYGLVDLGGSKRGAREAGLKHPVTFVALERSVARLLKAQLLAQQLSEPSAQYAIIRAYWQAVAATWPPAFEEPGQWYVTKHIGLQALGTFGAEIIDRALLTGNVEVSDLAAELEHVKDVYDWHRDAESGKGLGGMSGNRAALEIAGKLRRKLPKLAR